MQAQMNGKTSSVPTGVSKSRERCSVSVRALVRLAKAVCGMLSNITFLWKVQLSLEGFRSTLQKERPITGIKYHGNTPYPKLVCCIVHKVELPLLVLSSFSSFHCVLEKRFFFFFLIALECIGKALHINGWALRSSYVLRCWRSQHRSR